MQSIVINVKDGAIDKVLDILRNISDIEIIDKSSASLKTDDKWAYWKDEELDNFGKIVIGLSKHDYDDEDYSKW